MPSAVTDVFLDFDGTLTAGARRAHDYVVPLLEKCCGLRVTDVLNPEAIHMHGVITWEQLDRKMALFVEEIQLDLSDSSLFGSVATRRSLQGTLQKLVEGGIKLHVLTMGTPQAQKALMRKAGYNVELFEDFLGPFDMARNQGLQMLFDNGDRDGSETSEHFEFDVEQDIEAMELLRQTGEVAPVLRRIMSMEKKLSKADLILACAGPGAVLVDDSFVKNIFDASEKNLMYIHVDPEGSASTAQKLEELAMRLALGHLENSTQNQT